MIENVPVRIARPLNSKDNLPAIVYSHGGAFYLGSVGKSNGNRFRELQHFFTTIVDMYNAVTSALARLANVVVISVE